MAWDIVIVGGGILGASIAVEAARGRRVLLLRRPDLPRPQAETLRNQAWLQTGLLYQRSDQATARTIRDARNLLLQRFGIPAPPRGLLCGGDDVVRWANELAIRVEEIEPSVARREGALVSAARGRFFRIPDGPFPEAKVLALLRARAAAAGVELREINDPVQLVADRSNANGLQLTVAGQKIAARQIVLAAGAATPELLRPLEIDHGLRVLRTPLLRIVADDWMHAPLFVDLQRRFSVTQPLAGRHVFGAGSLSVEIDAHDERARSVPREQTDHLVALAKDYAGGTLPAYATILATAGFEISAAMKSKHEWHVGVDSRYPALTWALPGRATLAPMLADLLVSNLQHGTASDGSHLLDVGAVWSSPIEMYCSARYDNCDDTKVDEENLP